MSSARAAVKIEVWSLVCSPVQIEVAFAVNAVLLDLPFLEFVLVPQLFKVRSGSASKHHCRRLLAILQKTRSCNISSSVWP